MIYIYIFLLIFFIYFLIENNSLKITRLKIKLNIPESLKSLKFIHLSDLHKKTFGKKNLRLINKIKQLNPDIIFLSGDMVSRSTKKFENFEYLLKSLSKIAEVYYSFGNHETDLSPECLNKLITIIQQNNIKLLNNEYISFKKDNQTIMIYGLTLTNDCYKGKNKYSHLYKPSLEDLNQYLDKKQNFFTILLAHNPLFFEIYESWKADIILSGHMHGGIIRLPFLNGVLSPERKFFPKYSGGIYSKNQSKMIVNRGLGKIRLFNPPEIIFFNFQ